MNDTQIAERQALALVVNALETNEQGYISQLQTVEQPYLVANQLVKLLVDAVPAPKHGLLARQLRAQLATA